MDKLNQKVIDYYTQSHTDYYLLWNLHRNYAMHYGYYDKHHRTHDEALVNTNRVLAEKAKIQFSDCVLDMGCGVGGSAIWIAKNIGARVAGISLVPRQINKAKRLAEINQVKALTGFLVQDFTHTNFPDVSFDVVWAVESLCHAEHKKEVLTEIWRLLRPGGRLIVSDGFLNKDILTLQEEKQMKQWLDGWAIPHLAHIKEFHEHFQDLGFKNIEFQDATNNVMSSSLRMYVVSFFVYPLQRICEIFGWRSKVQRGNIVAAYYQYKTLVKRVWVHGIYFAVK